jgi:PAS domain S-box-containing protein
VSPGCGWWPRIPAWAGYASFAAAYLVFAAAGHLLLDHASGMAVWWPPTGLYMAALLLAGPGRWPAVVAVALPASLAACSLDGRPLGVGLSLFAGNTAEAIAGAWLVRRFGGPRPTVSTVRGALAITILPALAGAAISSAHHAVRVLTGDGGAGPWWVFWGGSSLGILVVAPFLLAWAEKGPPREARRKLPEVAAIAASGALAIALHSGRLGAAFSHGFVLLPPLVWAALRFGARGASGGIALASLATIWVRHDASPAAVYASQLFLAVAATLVLLVGAAVEERQKGARELAESRDLLGAFFANSPSGMFIKDEAHRNVVMSPMFAELHGRPVADMLGKTVAEVVPGPAGGELFAMERAVLAGGGAARKEIAIGGRTFIELIFPIPRPRGAPYLGGFALDVTDRVRAEARLRESAARLRLVEAAVDQASDAISVVDQAARIVWVNAAQACLAGIGRERLIGMRLFEAFPGLARDEWQSRWSEALERGVVVREEPIPIAGGGTVPGEVAYAVMEFGGRPYLVSSARDISDRRRAEAAARLAGIGTMAAGVAHEVNNPLAYVLANLAWMRGELGRDGDEARTRASSEEMRRVVEEALDGATRVRDIVKQLRLFARPDETVGPMEVCAALRAAIAIAQNEVRHHATLVTDLGEAPMVIGNENRLAQVFLNLLTNAAQAIPAGDADRNTIRVTVRRGDGGEAVVDVADTGAGMAPEVRARMFEPFFTTKPMGAGTGLGLFICHGIVSGMGGRIEIESEVGRGSTFRVLLPPATATAAVEAALETSSPIAARRGRVLVVDDDERVANALRRLLQGAHDVEIATSGRAAVERIRGGASWDVVFCDLMMPEMTGMQLHDEISRLAPGLASRVVFVTGGAFTDAARSFLERVPNARIEKPFTPEEIRTLVADRLGP